MTMHPRFSPPCRALAALTLLFACNGDDSATGSSDSATETATATAGTTDDTTTAGSMTASDSATTTDASGSNSDSATTTGDPTTTTDDPTTTTTTGDPTTTTTTDGETTTTGVMSATDTDDPPDCVEDPDCPEGQVCVNGTCELPPECVEDVDCGENQYCGAGKCIDHCQPGDEMMMGMVEQSNLWVANTNQGSISKVDTITFQEVARYRSGPSGGTESPSRTAVSVDGRFVVVANRGTGRVTMIAADIDDCEDLNNNGMIDTSQNPGDLRAWETDECVRWSTLVPKLANDFGAGPRGMTWTLGTWSVDTCAYEEPKVWVGYRPQNGVAHMAMLNGLTGAIEDTVVINPWNSGNSGWGPYGAALDKDQKVWFTGLRGNLYSIDMQDNNALATIQAPGGSQFYGMTVDEKGRTWTAGCVGPVYRYDPADQSWTAVPGLSGCLRGIGADREGSIWAARNGTCGVYQIDADNATLTQFHTLQPCSTPVGISVDIEGNVIVVDQWQGAWKIDPLNPNDKQFLPIADEHYTYSDMTGGQLKGALPQ